MKQCVYCDATNNLNTQLTIKLNDDDKIVVDICDEHAEEATVRTAREAFLAKQAKLKELLVQAQSMGLKVEGLKLTSGGLVIPTEQIPKAPNTPSQPVNDQINLKHQHDDMTGDDVITTDAVDGKSVQSVTGNVAGVNLTQLPSYNVNSLEAKLPPDITRGKVKLAIAEGRGGRPMYVPAKRVDGTGTLRIQILKKENDASLQRRFKQMADASIKDQVDMANNGYSDTQSVCPICHGSCFINDKTCPKCNGVGHISRY